MISYRDATAADLPAIDALFRESFIATFGHLYSPENLAAFLARFTPDAWAEEFATPGLAFRLAEDEGGLIGYCKIGPVTLPVAPGPDPVELRQLYLRERGKGSGAAQALMDWALATARARGAATLWLSVYIDNHRAKRFYERYGFVDRGRYAFMVGDHADEDRLMSLDL
ncbi:GNAT family N-acetyltransferase [Sphingomonas psychrotolerans]|uniref:GNAT family N-acetyltransferase n=1 Tax=Sphingomonas psychrotolerans TaxID=1327635 RepID=A0ABU3N391_9SPHN|nr:GNAT family N-acetyltransferase [Sphingomonas psychrotolerans]MDT8759014.1 GNAT family N-acetyltransferase [Sphingomonas psychrotolerans]